MSNVMQGNWLTYYCCPPAGPALTLTKVQDLNRVTFDPATGVLNVPPALAARRQAIGMTLAIAPNLWTPITGLGVDYLDTVGTMVPAAPDYVLVVPKTGYYDAVGAASVANMNDLNDRLSAELVLTDSVGNVLATELGRASVAAHPGLAVVVRSHIARQSLVAGQRLYLQVDTNKVGGVIVNSAQISLEYIEGA